jgi:hypothetical protein
MLRVETYDSANSLSLKLEGRFSGDDAENTRTLITRCREGSKARHLHRFRGGIIVFARFGAEFAASTSYTLDICGHLQLPLALTGTSQANSLRNSSTGNGQSRTQLLPDPIDSQKKGV